MSGQHFHEFREFLLKHPDTFLVDDEKETVILTNYSDVKSHAPPELHFQPDVKIDPVETQTLLDFLAQCIEVKGPILVEQLFQIVSCNLPEAMWTNLFNTPTHLTSFLRLFSDSFHIQSNLVTLLQPPKISQKHINNPQLSNNVKEPKPKEIKEKVDLETTKNAKNLANNNNTATIIEKVEKPEKLEKPEVVPTGPRSISDRLKQPKLQQKMQNDAAAQKSLSPEPPASPASPTAQQIDEKIAKGVNFRLGEAPVQIVHDKVTHNRHSELK